MREAACYGECHAEAAGCIEGAELQIIVQGPHFMEVSDEPQLRTGVPGSHVWGDEAWEQKNFIY